MLNQIENKPKVRSLSEEPIKEEQKEDENLSHETFEQQMRKIVEN